MTQVAGYRMPPRCPIFMVRGEGGYHIVHDVLPCQVSVELELCECHKRSRMNLLCHHIDTHTHVDMRHQMRIGEIMHNANVSGVEQADQKEKES
jgi:hypothetical protein